MDRTLLKSGFTKKGIPNWQCPTCGSGFLHGAKNSFIVKETSESKSAHKHPEWEPEWMQYTYTLMLCCSNESCGETVTSSGIGSVEGEYEYIEDYPELVLQDTFRPKYFFPPLVLFNISKETPDDVKGELIQSFELFFCNPPSSANHIRMALEKLLNHFKIKRFETRSGTRRFLSLHKRIEVGSTKFPTLKESFLALKWLGNAGSHSHKEVSIDDVIDAYEIFEFVLNELYKKKSVSKLIKKINKSKGPSRKKV